MMIPMGIRHKRRLLAIILIAVVVAAAIGGTGWWFMGQQVPIPRAVRKQLEFVIVYPGNDFKTGMDTRSFKYNTENEVFSYVMRVDGTEVTVTEQVTPDAFSDIPQYYEEVIQRMNGYKTIDTYNGKVDLTKPTSANGEQVAVFNNRGTLLFAHAERDIPEAEWRKLFNDVQFIKP